MSVRKRNVVTGRHSIQEKLEAVRLRMYGELSFNEVIPLWNYFRNPFALVKKIS